MSFIRYLLIGVTCLLLVSRSDSFWVLQSPSKSFRRLDGETVFLPFSDKFADYDKNDDGYITFNELLKAVMSTVNLSDPEDLIVPFRDSDTNGDKQLDLNEFANSEFLFSDDIKRRS